MRKRSLLGLASVIALYGGAVQAQDCGAFTKALDDSSKEISYLWAVSVADNSAPRQTNTELEINNSLLLREMNLMLMVQSKCPLPKEPMRSLEYAEPALGCATAMVTHTGKSTPTACDRSKWQKKH